MRLGLIADIHEDIERLTRLLARFREQQTDQIVCLGDVFETGARIEPACRLLADAGAIGVWGNHDFGLCCRPDPAIAGHYSPAVCDYLAGFRPRMQIGECEFAHIEPWLDPHDLADLWYFDGFPRTTEQFQRLFAAVRSRWTFAGHYHCWLIVTPAGLLDWQGDRPLRLDDPTPYFCVINAACRGCAAVFDTETTELTPIRVA